MFRDFPAQNHTPCLGISWKKVTNFSGTPPFTILGEYHPRDLMTRDVLKILVSTLSSKETIHYFQWTLSVIYCTKFDYFCTLSCFTNLWQEQKGTTYAEVTQAHSGPYYKSHKLTSQSHISITQYCKSCQDRVKHTSNVSSVRGGSRIFMGGGGGAAVGYVCSRCHAHHERQAWSIAGVQSPFICHSSNNVEFTLPSHIRNAPSVTSFKQALKTYMCSSNM